MRQLLRELSLLFFEFRATPPLSLSLSLSSLSGISIETKGSYVSCWRCIDSVGIHSCFKEPWRFISWFQPRHQFKSGSVNILFETQYSVLYPHYTIQIIFLSFFSSNPNRSMIKFNVSKIHQLKIGSLLFLSRARSIVAKTFSVGLLVSHFLCSVQIMQKESACFYITSYFATINLKLSPYCTL